MSLHLCPCCSGLAYTQCCRPFHAGKAAPTAEALMRARYSAYVLADAAYLHRSWHSSTRLSKKNLVQPKDLHWEKLEIIHTEAGQSEDQTGLVEFIAYFSASGQDQHLHERSRFVREKGRWVYLDALPTTPPAKSEANT